MSRMDAETVALLGGLLFLLLAIVGGGFTIRELNMPRIPIWARAACLVVGVVLVLPFVASALRSGSGASPDAVFQPRAESSAAQGTVVIYSDPVTSVSEHEIQVSALLATGERKPTAVGDRVRIEFSLKNVGTNPVTLNSTFIGARSPGSDNKDFGEENVGRVFNPGAVLDISHSIVLDARGTWQFWPCYILRTGEEGTFCPDEWRAFQVSVG
jgi:hypothetical protein